MTEYVFADRVKIKFRYLIDDYGFIVIDELYDPEAFGNSLVQFRSNSMDITVVLDRGQVHVDIAPYPNPSGFRFSLPTVVELLAPESGETDYIYPDELEEYHDKIDWQVERLARLLRQYAEPVLRGEFSAWAELEERRQRDALATYRKMTGREPIKVESEALAGEMEREIERRKAAQKRRADTPPATNEAQEARPWWAFWRQS